MNATVSPAAPVMTKRQILLVVIGLMMGMFLSALDQTVVSTSMRTIADDLDGMAMQAWVTTAYMIVSTIATPLYGKLSDIFGRRLLFIIAISIFLLGSLLAGTAHTMYELAAYRAIQGLGAGGLMALPLAIMGDMLSPRERVKYQGFFLAVFGVSSIVGPLIGGLFAGAPEILWIEGWRWVFLINLPVGFAALAFVLRFLHLPRQHHAVRIDWWGAGLVIAAATPLLLVAEQGREWGWGSIEAWTCYIVGVVASIAFVFVERWMGDDALIPMKLFKSPTFSMATILGVFVGFGMFGGMMTIPLYLQLVMGASPTESGFMMLPMILGMMIATIASGQIMGRTGSYALFPRLGTFLLAAGFLFMTFLTYDKPYWFVMIGMFMIGLGLGQLMQTLTVASQNSVSSRDMGVATSSSTFFRSLGGTAGTAVLFSVLFSVIPNAIKDAFAQPGVTARMQAAMMDPAVTADPQNAKILELLQSGQKNPASITTSLDGDTSFLNGANAALSEPFLNGFAHAVVTVYWIAFAVTAVAFLLSLFMKTTPLRQKSAMQEAADAALMAEAAAETMGAMVEPGTAGTAADLKAAEEREEKRQKARAAKRPKAPANKS